MIRLKFTVFLWSLTKYTVKVKPQNNVFDTTIYVVYAEQLISFQEREIQLWRIPKFIKVAEKK